MNKLVFGYTPAPQSFFDFFYDFICIPILFLEQHLIPPFPKNLNQTNPSTGGEFISINNPIRRDHWDYASNKDLIYVDYANLQPTKRWYANSNTCPQSTHFASSSSNPITFLRSKFDFVGNLPLNNLHAIVDAFEGA